MSIGDTVSLKRPAFREKKKTSWDDVVKRGFLEEVDPGP